MDRTNFTPNRKGTRTTSAYEEFTVREFIAFAPMWLAYQQFWVEDGDRVPTTFSRNARHRDLVARRHAAMSRPRRRGRPRTVRSIRALVLRLVAENPS